MVPRIIHVISILFFVLPLFSQRVGFLIQDTNKNPLVAALFILKSDELSFQVQELSDDKGMVWLEKVVAGKFAVEISYLGFEDFTDSVDISAGRTLYTFSLAPAGQIMDEIQIVAKKPLLRQDGDKIIVDPEPLLGFSTNTLEVLEATPGLIVDSDNGIFLNNTQPAAIYINGREQRTSVQDIMNILRSLPPGHILRIEIVRNPSARFDASSSGGIINIVLKKGVKLGQYGSINAGFNQGKAGNRFGGFSFNNTGSRSGFNVQANYTYDAVIEDLESARSTSLLENLQQNTENDRRNHGLFTAAGFDYTFANDDQFQYYGTFQSNQNLLDSRQFNAGFLMDSLIFFGNNRIENTNPQYSHRHDLGWIRKLDTIGSELEIKCSVGQSFPSSDQFYILSIEAPFSNVDEGNGKVKNIRNYFSGQIDYTKKWDKILQLETGIKSDIQQFRSDAGFTKPFGTTNITDTLRTTKYNYNDAIHAAYIQFSRDFPWKLTLKTGVRAENTNMSGNQVIPSDTSFQIRRTDFFPYVFLSRDLFSVSNFALKGFAIYRRTINRPSFQNLNPAIQVLDAFNYASGNPGLSPQFTDNFEFNISFDENPIFAIGRNYTTGIISSVLYEDPDNPVLTYNTFDNIGKSKETYFRLVGAIPPGKKYFFVVGTQYNHLEYEGVYNGLPVSFSRGSWRFFTFHNLKITKTWRLSLFGFMLVNGQQNFLELGRFGQMNLTLSKSFLDEKLNISVFGRDIFRTMETPFRLDQGGIIFEGNRYSDNQRWGMTLRYNFGLRNKKEENNLFDVPMGN